ncbi:DUF6493 family protein [Nonomuraea sp. CA-141351]|uniref:DUF7824 domain-containing protein n=1 Tax=Nonomuraea sp. CA-141351 TaxID=3239996 RepID=UPI003D8D325C
MRPFFFPARWRGGRVSAWERLVKLAARGATGKVVRLIGELDAAGRKEVAERLPGYVATLRPEGDGSVRQEQLRSMLLAGVGCLGGAAAVAAWLFRREFRWMRGDDELVLELLRERPAAWKADVARRIARRLRVPELRHWEVAAAFVRETGIEPPAGDAFMVGWLRALDSKPVATDPLFAAFAPRIFEIDGLGEALPDQVGTIVRLVEDGLLERKVVIDGVVGRLLRDGPSAPAALAILHDRLDLDIDESAERAADYTRLLPAGPVPVADLALAQLRRLEEAGRLEEELFAEAVEALAFRPEKKLLRAVVSWAGDAVLRDAGRVDVVLAALSVIFAQDTLALQERAVRLAVKLARQAGEPGREAIRQAAAVLPGELREKISAAYGGGIEAEEVAVTPLPAVGDGPAMPAPIASAERLVREAAAPDLDPYTFERLLAGLAEWSHRAPAALREALRPWSQPIDPVFFGHYGDRLYDGAVQAVRRAFLAFASPEDSRSLSKTAVKQALPLRALDRIYVRRAHELARSFEGGNGYPVLLATPTAGTGHIDPGVLLDRLEVQEAAGVRALPLDLAQALLRLPRDIPEVCRRRAEGLTSEAGRTCDAWMRGGRPADPGVKVLVVEHRPRQGEPTRDLKAELSGDLPEPIRELYELETGYAYTLEWWPLVMPSHREVVAAHLIWNLSVGMEFNDLPTQALVGLAYADGPIGEGMAHALACGMGHANATSRAAATDALLTLAARRQVPVAALGKALTELVTRGVLKLNRVVSVLDDATQAGAHETVWELIVRLLPGLLPKEGERPRAGVADLLAAGARAARIAGIRAELPEVAAVAARKGSSRMVQEARRLRHLVTAPEKSTL